MGGDPEDPSRRHGDGDQIQFGSSSTPRWALPRWARRPLVRRLTAVAATATVTAVAVTVAVLGAGGAPRPPAGDSTHDSAAGSADGAGLGPVTVKALGHALLDETTNWELLAVAGGWEPEADGGALIRIQFAKGIITDTRIPALDSTGPASVLAVGGEVIIRPLDFVPGYAVPDGRSARGLPAALDNGGLTFPGPRPGQLWIGSYGDAGPVLRLVTTAGAASGPVIRLPSDESLGVPDGQGYVLVQLGKAVVDARPNKMHTVAAGTLLATGPSAWLVSNCPAAARCANTVVDPATGTRRVLPGDANLFGRSLQSGPPGQISPDGRLAALLHYGPGRDVTVGLVDLRTGAQHDVPVGPVSPNGILVWSPDSRWLFTLTAAGAIEAVDVHTGQVRGLSVALPPVSYLAAGSPA